MNESLNMLFLSRQFSYRLYRSLVIFPAELDLSLKIILSIHEEVAIIRVLRLENTKLDQEELHARQDDDVIVQHHSHQQDTEPYELEVEEALPSDGHADHPDDQGPHTVQDHPGGGRQLLGHGDASKVEEGN